jgi:hypothetical protein
MTNELNQNEPWIALIKVKQSDRSGPLGDADQGYTNVVALAKNKNRFRKLVSTSLDEIGLELLRMESAEPLGLRMSRYSVDEEILKLASELNSENWIAFDVFATYDID